MAAVENLHTEVQEKFRIVRDMAARIIITKSTQTLHKHGTLAKSLNSEKKLLKSRLLNWDWLEVLTHYLLISTEKVGFKLLLTNHLVTAL